MLTLKKEPAGAEFTLALSSKQPLFSREFCQALSWAVGIHALGVLLFTIQMITYTGSTVILDPVTVLTEPLELTQGGPVVTDASSLTPERGLLPEPPSMGLEPPSFIHDASLISPAPLARPFLMPQWAAASPPPPPIRISATGHLAGRAFAYPKDIPILKFHGDYQAAYQVRVDGATGEIFWFKLQRSSGLPAIDRAAEEIVRNMQFQSDQASIQSGTIEIAFHLDSAYD
jgi:hypothetical protein